MSAFYYDLHLHSCLSPCGDMQMTPPNLVGTAKLNGLDVIALTDHNTVKNCPAAIACGREYGILVIPGMELCTAEEAHVVCLFPTIEMAIAFEAEVDKNRLGIHNRPEIFGRQVVMDEEENEITEVGELLTAATKIGVFDVVKLVSRFGGAAFPAHIDREAFSVPALLGFISDDMNFQTVEFSSRIENEAEEKKQAFLRPLSHQVNVLYNSDAHYLENIAERKHSIELPELDSSTLLSKIRQENC